MQTQRKREVLASRFPCARTSVRQEHVADVDMSQMMDHLIESERHPKRLAADVLKAAEIARPRLDAIHEKMNAEVERRQPPHGRVHVQRDRESDGGMNAAVNGKWRNEVPART